jgi:Fe-S-cluster containining protein
MEYTEFVETYCRWTPFAADTEQLSLREKANYDCVFWNEGCSVYEERPLQCRTFPFWSFAMTSRSAWEALGVNEAQGGDPESGCPGINRGELHAREYIDACIARRKAEPVMTRKNL